jgi:hypothetical protein
MAANPDWARWIFASVAFHLKAIATTANLAVIVEHLDERTEEFMQAADRAEIRITGPSTQELAKGQYRLWVDANVLLTSRYDGAGKNAYDIIRLGGLFQEAMDSPIPVWNYGNQLGDYVDADPDSHVSLGCLLVRPGRNESVRLLHFGQTDKTDKLKQTVCDARYVMYINEE